jgi:threonine dehydrogenase-like Zn-dependent dehydrogenase
MNPESESHGKRWSRCLHRCLDLEAHSAQLQGTYDKIKVALLMETDRPIVLRQAIQAVRKGGTLSVPEVYCGLLDKVPFGAAFGKGITMKMGQTNMHNYMKPLLERIENGQIDPSYIISHRITLEQAPEMYKVWRDKKENVTRISHRPLGRGSSVGVTPIRDTILSGGSPKPRFPGK